MKINSERGISYANPKGAQGQGEIFLVTAERFSRLDANWLQIGRIYLEGLYFAEQYWNGSERPRWEYLLGFPVTIQFMPEKLIYAGT